VGAVKENFINNDEYEDAMESYETIDELEDDEIIPIQEITMPDEIKEVMDLVTKAMEMQLKVMQMLRERVLELEHKMEEVYEGKGLPKV